jgi:hypothetical protein
MAKEFSTNKDPNTTVKTKIIFSKPLSDLYMLKELLRVEDNPDDLDCIRTRTIKRPETTNCNIFAKPNILFPSR